jgi:hypothetical protein
MPKPAKTKKAVKKKTQQQSDTGSDNDSNSGSPEAEVSDILHVLLRTLAGIVDIATKVENHQPQGLKDMTKDIRICSKEGTGSHPVKNTTVDGWYCKYCL